MLISFIHRNLQTLSPEIHAENLDTIGPIYSFVLLISPQGPHLFTIFLFGELTIIFPPQYNVCFNTGLVVVYSHAVFKIC